MAHEAPQQPRRDVQGRSHPDRFQVDQEGSVVVGILQAVRVGHQARDLRLVQQSVRLQLRPAGFPCEPSGQRGENDHGDGSREHERRVAPVADLLPARRPFPVPGRRFRLAATAAVAALADHAGQHVVRQLEPAHALAIVHAQQAAADQHVQLFGGDAGERQRVLQRAAVAKTALGDQLVLHERPHARIEAGHAALVETREDLAVGALQQLGSDAVQGGLRLLALVIQLAAHHAE